MRKEVFLAFWGKSSDDRFCIILILSIFWVPPKTMPFFSAILMDFSFPSFR
jgi:hypothetical protein